MAVDFKVGQKIINVIAVYLSHAGYNWKYFTDTLSDTEDLVMEAIEKSYLLLVT